MNKAYKQTKQYYKADQLVYSCQYHVIFCPKYRRKILNEGSDVRLKEVFWDTAARHGFSIPEIRRRLPCMWTRSVFLSTVGSFSPETVKRYIESQKGT